VAIHSHARLLSYKLTVASPLNQFSFVVDNARRRDAEIFPSPLGEGLGMRALGHINSSLHPTLSQRERASTNQTPMLFTNGNYFVFLAAVFFVYWLFAAWRLPRIWLLLAASYYFYALWNPKFLALLFLISTFDFLNAMAIGKARSRPLRKCFVGLSVLLNVGGLFLFKYFNFFSSSLTDLLHKAGWHGSVPILESLVLPLGLSFIAFRSLSYVIDVYRGTIEPTRRFVDYLTFVAFFPTIIAGPLARAKDLLPQFRAQPHLSNEEGAQALFLIMLGLVKKIAIADFLANNLVDRVFDQPQLY
jgi:alginate O-acetyltransferase complex protein AlgI